MNFESGFIAALFDPETTPPECLRACPPIDTEQRFAVYRNNVASSLVAALADSFPVTQELVGVRFFQNMALAFVRRSPPSSPLLIRYGSEFPAFIGNFPPARSVVYLSDVARIEWLRLQAFHAADVEPVEASAFSSLLAVPESLDWLCFVLHPSLGILVSSFAAPSIWAAHQGSEAVRLWNIDCNKTEAAMVVRTGMQVQTISVSLAGAIFVDRLRTGHTLSESVSCAIDADPSFDLAEHLAMLIRQQAITAITVRSEH